jgi:hypothetical protein
MIDQDQQRNNVLVQACTYEKSTNRVMLSLEELWYIIKPDASKARYLGLVERTKAFFAFMSKGYNAAGTPGSPQDNGQSFVRTPQQTINENVAEQERKAENQARTANSGNWAGDQVSRRLQQLNRTGTFKQNTTQEQWENTSNPEKASQLSDEEYWNNLTTIYEPGGNPATLFLLTVGGQESAKTSAAQNTREELLANGGIPSGRTCKNWVAADPTNDIPGYCAAWETTVPGSVLLGLVKEYGAALLAFFSNNDNVGSDFVNQAQNPLDQITNFAANPNTDPTTQNTSQAGTDPCPDPEGCPKTGWKSGQINTETVSRALEQGINSGFDALNNLGGSSGNNGNGGNNQPNFDPSALSNLLNNFQLEINSFEAADNDTRLTWNTTFASDCRAANDWVGTDYQANQSLADNGITVGQVSILLPASHPAITYQISCSGILPTDIQTAEVIIPATTNSPTGQ